LVHQEIEWAELVSNFLPEKSFKFILGYERKQKKPSKTHEFQIPTAWTKMKILLSTGGNLAGSGESSRV
jgi:hypothetical protein